MYGKIAIALAVAALLVIIAGASYAISTSKLVSLDMSCAPLKTYNNLYNNQITVHDLNTGKDITYTQKDNPDTSFCLYQANFVYKHIHAFGIAVIALLILAIIFTALHYTRETKN